MGRKRVGGSMKKFLLFIVCLFVLSANAFAYLQSDSLKIKDDEGEVATLDGSFAANRAITVPDEAGTLCTTGSVCTGYQATLDGGNITYVDCGDSIASAITAATAGDTLVLGSCTYTESAISVSKAISIKGQGPEKTIINNTGTNVATFAVTADGFHIDGVGFTGTDVSEAIDIDCTGGTTCNNNSIRNFKINISRTLGGLHGIQLIDAGARIEHGSINYSSATTATDQVHGIFQKFVSTCELDTVSYITDVHITGTATGDSTTQLLRGLMLWNNDADTSATNHTEYVRDVTIKLTPGNSTISSEGFVTQGGTNLLTAYVFDSNIDGGTGGGSNVNNDIRIETTTAAYFTNVTLGTGRTNNQGNLYRNGEIQAAGLTIDAITTVEDSTGATGGVGEGGLIVTGGNGGASTIATTGTGGAGSPISITGGAGGVAASANTASTGGSGSPITFTAGAGAAASATGTNVGGAGGKLSLVGGSGGNASGGSSNTGGAGSSIYAYPGTGGTGATANGSDGNVYLLSSSDLSDVNGNLNVNFTTDSDVIDSRIKLDVRANGNNAGIGATAYSGTAATTGTLILGKSRGTQASSTTVAADDDLGNIRFFGYDGTNWQSTASIQTEADGTVSAGNLPTRLSLFTGPVASEVRRFTIFNDGSALFGGSTTTIPSGNTYSFDAISTTTTPTIGIVRTDTTITNGEVAGQLRFHGKDTQLTTQNAYASIQAIANGDTTTDAAAGDLAFLTTTSTAGGSPTEAGRFTTDGHLRLGGRTAASELRFLEASGSGSNYTAFKAQPQAGDITYVLPPDDGDASEVLTTNGSGSLTWEAAGAGDVTAVGNCTSGACFDGTSGTTLTFNNAGGDATLDYDGTDLEVNKDFKVNVGASIGNFNFTNVASSFPFLMINNTLGTAPMGGGIRFQKNGANQFGFGIDYVGDGSRNWWVYDYVASLPRLLIDPNGNVGISSTAPDATLEVNGASGGKLRLTYNDNNGSATNYSDLSVSSGGDLTITPSGGDVTVAGTVTSSATGSLGWSIVSAANQACTTTCTSAAVHGWDTTSGEVAVSSTDATADKCLCAGAS